MNEILAIGEILIDFIPSEKGRRLKDVVHFQRAAGGAPANVAATVAKLGGKSCLFSQVGNDHFGLHLRETLVEAGVDVTPLAISLDHPTALAFVSLDATGNRDFTFFRDNCADLAYESSQLDPTRFVTNAILHFGSVDLIESPMKHAHETAISLAHQKGCWVTFDPNVRLPLWPNADHYRHVIQSFIPQAHLLKVSDDELPFITQIEDEKKAIQSLFQGHVRVVIVTRGAHGISLYTPDFSLHVPALPVHVVDTTGAGDSVMGSVLFQLSQRGTIDLPQIEWQSILEFAAATAACVVEKPGAISALPTHDEVTQRLAQKSS